MIIDMHRHFGGCVTPEFVWSVIQKKGLYYLAESKQDVESSMVFYDHEPRGFHRFLQKFTILNELKWDEEMIRDSIHDVAHKINAEDIRYTWMRFSINKYMETIQWHKEDVIKFIYDIFDECLPERFGLILSLKYESLRANQKQYAKLIESKAADYLVGIDLVGDEGFFDADFYAPIFKEWSNAGKVLCAHVGESCSHNNIRDAILKMGVKHIAHGIKIVNDKELIAIAKDNDVCFDLAITSNKITGCWDEEHEPHPVVEMLQHGLKVTVGTDDPVQLNTTMTNEYEILSEIAGDGAVEKCQNTAVERTAIIAPQIMKEIIALSTFENLFSKCQGG